MIAARRAWLFWGVATAACYLVAVLAVMRPVPVRILYEGMAPLPPYRWVTPPPELASGNETPKPWNASIEFHASGSVPMSFATGDGQVIAVFRQGAVTPRPGETSVRVTLTPLDPSTVARAPEGLRFDGNAYRVEAVYPGSGEAAALTLPVTIVLRYARHATALLRFDGSTWTGLSATAVPESMQIFATSERLGAFVAAGPPQTRAVSPWWAYAASALLLFLAMLVLLRSRRDTRSPRQRTDPSAGAD
jgi:hypothetical protein